MREKKRKKGKKKRKAKFGIERATSGPHSWRVTTKPPPGSLTLKVICDYTVYYVFAKLIEDSLK